MKQVVVAVLAVCAGMSTYAQQSCMDMPDGEKVCLGKPATTFTWKAPMVNFGTKPVPVAYCLYEKSGSVSGCGQAAADAFCRSAKLSRAKTFNAREVPDRMQMVYFYGDNVYSYTYQYSPKYVTYQALSDVTCE